MRVTKARSVWRGRDQRAAVTHLPLFIRALWEHSHKRPVVNESWKLLVQTIIPHENVYQSILFVTLFASLHLNFNCWAGSRNNTETVGWQPQQNKLWRWGSWWAQTLDKNKTFKAHHGEHHMRLYNEGQPMNYLQAEMGISLLFLTFSSRWLQSTLPLPNSHNLWGTDTWEPCS